LKESSLVELATMTAPSQISSNALVFRNRLLLLRQELELRGLDGFLVPRSDEHQGEYVPPRAMRLAWISGFSGSAGMAVILRDRAALFIDGRYTLQAEAEVDHALFSRHHLIDEPPADWLAKTLPAGAKLGFDPWLHTPKGVEKLETACAKAGAHLTALDSNPLDAVWLDQPEPPLAPVVPHPQDYAGQSSAEKRSAVAQSLIEDRQDAAFLSAPDSIAWLLNIRGEDVEFSPLPLCFAIAHRDGSLDLFLDSRKRAPGLEAELGEEVRLHRPLDIGPVLDGLSDRTVRLDADSAPAWIEARLKAAKAKVVRGNDPCLLPKACKNDVELSGTRQAHLRDGVALVRFLSWLDRHALEDVSECSVANRLEDFRRQNALYRGPSFPTIAGAGPNGAIVHYRATAASDRKLETGQLFLLDSGGQYLDGTTDVTRTIAVGTPGEEERCRFTLVLKGHIAIATAKFPVGTTGSQLDVLARLALWAEGLDYDHGTGHGVGSYLSVHEGPQRISKVGNAQALKPGMVVSNEPGYYKTGAYGIRIENLLAVQTLPPTGERLLLSFETLTLAPIDRRLIVTELLTEAETAWLNSYHKLVAERIGPLVDGDSADWLERATRPLAAG
jgi:Xaa-Pro aminopeptidase